VPCIGKGESPDPLAVNMAVWEIRKCLAAQPNLYILVHCTHGFNRSGEPAHGSTGMQCHHMHWAKCRGGAVVLCWRGCTF